MLLTVTLNDDLISMINNARGGMGGTNGAAWIPIALVIFVPNAGGSGITVSGSDTEYP